MNNRLLYWLPTGLLCLLMLFSASMYFMNYDMVCGFFKNLGYPTYIVYPLAFAKVLGVIAILTNRSKLLSEWAYAGFFFDTILASTAHVSARDGQEMMAIAGVILVLLSRYFWSLRKVA